MKDDLKKAEIPFTQVANRVLVDPTLSMKAKGIYAYAYSKPKGWEFSAKRIAKDCQDKERSLWNGLGELVKAGYLQMHKKGSGAVTYEFFFDPDVQNSSQAKQQSAKTAVISNTEEDSNKEEEEDTVKNSYEDEYLEYPNFCSFWKDYPDRRKGSKFTTFTHWKKIKLEDRLEEVTEGLDAWKLCEDWLNGFEMNAERWVKNRCWETHPPPGIAKIVLTPQQSQPDSMLGQG